MRDELYFLPILAEALIKPDTKESLTNAFDQIQRLGSQQRYHHGFVNFLQFMGEASNFDEALNEDHIRQIMLEIASSTDKFSSLQKEGLIKIIASSDKYQREYEEIGHLIRFSEVPNWYPVINVYCDRRIAGTLEFKKQAFRQSIGNIVPGRYAIKLDTGWLLWQGLLTDKDLLWAKAFDKESLKFAADSGQTNPEPVRRINLLEGQIIVEFFAGIESGMIEIQLRDPNGN